MLAGVSVDYYTKMERGDLRGVSDSVLDALARGLRLDEAERAHLFDLARAAGPSSPARRRRTAAQRVRPSVQRIIDAMTHAPALVQNGRGDILAANRLGYALYSEMDLAPGRPANHARFVFLDPRAHALLRRVGTRRRRHRRDAAHRSRPRPTRPQPHRPRRRALHPQRRLPHPLGRAQRPRPPDRHQALPPPRRRRPHPHLRDPRTRRRPRPAISSPSAPSPAPRHTTRSTCSEAGPPPPGTRAFRGARRRRLFV